MIIAAALSENNLNSPVDVHFSRCNWFGIYNSITKNLDFIVNPGISMDEDAGLKSAEILVSHSVNVAVAGRFSAKVVELFRKANVQMVIPETNTSFLEFINLIKK